MRNLHADVAEEFRAAQALRRGAAVPASHEAPVLILEDDDPGIVAFRTMDRLLKRRAGIRRDVAPRLTPLSTSSPN
jgi:hypothetical protein